MHVWCSSNDSLFDKERKVVCMSTFRNPLRGSVKVRTGDVGLGNPARTRQRLETPREVLFPGDDWSNGVRPFSIKALKFMRGSRKLRTSVRYPESMRMKGR